MTKHDFEYSHERNPLVAAALRFHGAATRLPAPPRSGGFRAMLEREASRIVLCLSEAVDEPDVRAKRLAMARACSVRATALLRVLQNGGFLDDRVHQQTLQLLRVVSVKLELLTRKPGDGKPETGVVSRNEELGGPASDYVTADDEAVKPGAIEPEGAATLRGDPNG